MLCVCARVVVVVLWGESGGESGGSVCVRMEGRTIVLHFFFVSRRYKVYCWCSRTI